MHVITTHANADFDAVASLMAAHRLYPEAMPVLPHTLNRNVRDFITLHENQLPFIHPKELGPQTITRLTVVDTQQTPDLRRMAEDISIHIIDHHELRDNLPTNAILSLTDTGANVTLLVEQLREISLRLSQLEASLFLLGIYEDTGSLTYANTTPRDLQAAAWLLAEGRAHLDLVREYLNYPMSDEQAALYEQLVNELETVRIHGHTVLIGALHVNHYVAEISSIAHRLRDLYNPPALFLLISMNDHVQLVARSGTDKIDVGRISRALGGGGHDRAASAFVKGTTLAEVVRHLKQLLPLTIQPAITVAQIMSKGAHTLSPNDTVKYAASMMNRYGHEGFPVVTKQNKIVGILSRREVDKALRHKLGGASIDQFMTKGEFLVYPTDSLQKVRQIMVKHRIGQVPVINPDNQQIFGIITRTDLINQWETVAQGEEDITTQTNLAQPLRQRLSPRLLSMLQTAGQLAAEAGDTLYVVGGFVRDLLLTIQPQADATKTSPRFDLDLVVEGNAIKLAEQLQQQHGGRIYTHQRFGTAKWMLTEPLPFDAQGLAQLDALDFVTARTEFYQHPSALPEVEKSSIRLDLHRRDFTINTLALNLSPEHFGNLLDFYQGQADLDRGLIRVLHSLSFVEDPTRMLRAARLLARLNFALEERTAEHLVNALDLLERVSGERLAHELELIVQEQQPHLALQKLAELDILTTIHPALQLDKWLHEKLPAMPKLAERLAKQFNEMPRLALYLALLLYRLPHETQEEVMERLVLPLNQRKIITQTSKICAQAAALAAATTNSELYHLLHPSSKAARAVAQLATDDPHLKQQITHFETKLKDVSPLIDGTYLKQQFKLTPGPIFSTILNRLRDARLDGQVETLADEHALAEQIIAAPPSP